MLFRELRTSGTPPPFRDSHTAVQAGDGRILVFGGTDGASKLRDLWVLDSEGWVWREVRPGQRHGPQAHGASEAVQVGAGAGAGDGDGDGLHKGLHAGACKVDGLGTGAEGVPGNREGKGGDGAGGGRGSGAGTGEDGTCEETGSSVLCSEHEKEPSAGAGAGVRARAAAGAPGEGGSPEGANGHCQTPHRTPDRLPRPESATGTPNPALSNEADEAKHAAGSGSADPSLVHQRRALAEPHEQGPAEGVASSAEETRENPVSCLDSSTTGGAGARPAQGPPGSTGDVHRHQQQQQEQAARRGDGVGACWPCARESHTAIVVVHQGRTLGAIGAGAHVEGVAGGDGGEEGEVSGKAGGEVEEMVVFGGSSEAADGSYLQDLWALDTSALTWRQVQPASRYSPLPRDSHCAAVLEGRMVVFGGCCGGRYLDDVDVFDFGTERWTKVRSRPHLGSHLPLGSTSPLSNCPGLHLPWIAPPWVPPPRGPTCPGWHLLWLPSPPGPTSPGSHLPWIESPLAWVSCPLPSLPDPYLWKPDT